MQARRVGLHFTRRAWATWGTRRSLGTVRTPGTCSATRRPTSPVLARFEDVVRDPHQAAIAIGPVRWRSVHPESSLLPERNLDGVAVADRVDKVRVCRQGDSLPSRRLWRARWRWGLRSCGLLDPFKNRVVDERRIARGHQRHRIAGVQQHVQVGHLLCEGDKHRSLGGSDLDQQAVAVTLLAYYLTLDTFTRSAHALRQVWGNERGSSVRQADTDDSPDEEGANEDNPSSHGEFTETCSGFYGKAGRSHAMALTLRILVQGPPSTPSRPTVQPRVAERSR